MRTSAYCLVLSRSFSKVARGRRAIAGDWGVTGINRIALPSALGKLVRRGFLFDVMPVPIRFGCARVKLQHCQPKGL
jgi:hypothetical protein